MIETSPSSYVDALAALGREIASHANTRALLLSCESSLLSCESSLQQAKNDAAALRVELKAKQHGIAQLHRKLSEKAESEEAAKSDVKMLEDWIGRAAVSCIRRDAGLRE